MTSLSPFIKHEMREKATKEQIVACLLGTPLQAQTPAARVNDAVIGMPIYAADGIIVGQITNIGSYRGKRSMIGEVGRTLGFGVRQVLIPNDLATI